MPTRAQLTCSMGALFFACMFTHASPKDLPPATNEVSWTLDAIKKRCPADVPKAIEGGVAALNSLPQREGLPPITVPEADTSTFLQRFAEIENSTPRLKERDLAKTTIERMLTNIPGQSEYYDYGFKVDSAGGIGIEARLNEAKNELIVVNTFANTPAQKGGVVPGDAIKSIDGKPIEGLQLNDAIALLRGPLNSTVKLVLRHEDQTNFRELEVIRQAVVVPALTTRTVGRLGVIKIAEIRRGQTKAIYREIKSMRTQPSPPTAFVLDLRNNPGGALDDMVDLADAFLEDVPVASVASANECPPQPPESYRSHKKRVLAGMPIFVLVDGGTASGAELLARALKAFNHATIIGEKTRGSGLVQTYYAVSRTSAVYLATGELLDFAGRKISGAPITPDFEVPQSTSRHDFAVEKVMELVGN